MGTPTSPYNQPQPTSPQQAPHYHQQAPQPPPQTIHHPHNNNTHQYKYTNNNNIAPGPAPGKKSTNNMYCNCSQKKICCLIFRGLWFNFVLLWFVWEKLVETIEFTKPFLTLESWSTIRVYLIFMYIYVCNYQNYKITHIRCFGFGTLTSYRIFSTLINKQSKIHLTVAILATENADSYHVSELYI